MDFLSGPETTSKRVARVVRGAGLAIPLLFCVYTFLAQQGIVTTETGSFDAGTATFLCATWVVIGIFQIIWTSKTKLASLWRFIINHVLAASFLLVIVGFTSPLVYTWAILIAATHVYFRFRGLGISITSLYIVSLLDAYLDGLSAEGVLTNIFIATTVALIGGMAAAALRSSSIDQEEVDRSQEEVYLQQNHILTLVNNVADAIISTDKKGIITIYNAAVLNLLDTNVELEGMSIDEVLQLQSVTNGEFVKASTLLRHVRTVTEHDQFTTTISGEQTRLNITLSPIRGNFKNSHDGNNGYIFILRDITKEKSLEEERDEFISVVSHELRTPITIAEGTISNAQLLMKKKPDDTAAIEKAIDLAHEQVVFLARMVNDLSTLSRAERGVADEPEVIDLDEMIHDFFNEYEVEASEKNLALNIHIPTRAGYVYASRLYLKELLQNFITNAIKYTREGTVDMSVEHNVKDNSVTIRVKDTGIGISKADQKLIFDKFYRSEDYRTRETGGTGLGLYVAVKLAKKIGTRIDVRSRLNHGSTFSVTLPTHNPGDTNPEI